MWKQSCEKVGKNRQKAIEMFDSLKNIRNLAINRYFIYAALFLSLLLPVCLPLPFYFHKTIFVVCLPTVIAGLLLLPLMQMAQKSFDLSQLTNFQAEWINGCSDRQTIYDAKQASRGLEFWLNNVPRMTFMLAVSIGLLIVTTAEVFYSFYVRWMNKGMK